MHTKWQANKDTVVDPGHDLGDCIEQPNQLPLFRVGAEDLINSHLQLIVHHIRHIEDLACELPLDDVLSTLLAWGSTACELLRIDLTKVDRLVHDLRLGEAILGLQHILGRLICADDRVW